MQLGNVFIGGPPRSGTSLLVRMLDWHPRVLTFPAEPQGIADRYFFGDPIDAAGKEFIYGDRGRLDRMSTVFADLDEPDNQAFCSSFDTDAFAAAVAEEEDYFEGLKRGLLDGSSRVRARYSSGGSWFALKLPFFVEASAKRLARGVGGLTKFLYCRRDPVPRYASAKARRAKAGSFPEPVGGLDYASQQALLHRASEQLAARALGSGLDVLHVEYTEAAFSSTQMERICRFLAVPADPAVFQSTFFGLPQALPSAHGFVNTVEDAPDLRQAAVKSILTDAEAAYVCAIVDGNIAAAVEAGMETFDGEPEASQAARRLVLRDLEPWLLSPWLMTDFVRAHRPPLI